MQITPAPKKLTPMMVQYRSIKETLSSDTVLFFRLGDFYEMFFEDAVRASELLNITLTGREAGEAGRVPMCGIPYHAFQGYVRILIQKNFKVAICEQIGDPKAGKGLVERKITRMISPATYLEDENKDKASEYMAAFSQKDTHAAIAYLDLGTGEFYVRELLSEKLLHDLSLLNPKEVILSKSVHQRQSFLNQVKQQLNPSLTVYEDWVFEYEEAAVLLQETFRLTSRASEFFQRELAVRATGAILYYLRDHLHTSLKHLSFPKLMDQSEFMILDRQTQKSLELVEALSGEKQAVTLISTLDQTLTCMGARTLYQMITHPLVDLEKIEERQKGLSQFVDHPQLLIQFRELLKGIRDIERVLSRLNCGLANGRDLVNLKIFLRRIPEIRKTLSFLNSSYLENLNQQIESFPDLEVLIDQAILDEPPSGIKDGGLIKESYSPALEELRKISFHGKAWLLEFEKRETARTGIKSLKIKYSQVFGYAIDISKSYLHLVPQDYIRKQTLANAERFIVPELQVWDEKISGAEDKIKTLEYHLFDEVRMQVLEKLAGLQKMARAIGEADALASLAIAAIQRKWIRPALTRGSEIEIIGGRHPIVESVLPSGQFVDNDTRLDGAETQLIVLTGPNMAGKSTYIRQTGLIVLLAQIGSYVPAAQASIGIVDRIFTRIGAADDLAKGESTFMVEMLETAHILKSCTPRSLLILDEVGRGTSTFDGVSIAWSICEHLVTGKVKPRTLFATHYHELTQLEGHFTSIRNYQMKVSETAEGIIFLRKVILGSADRSYGIHVAELAGLPKEVILRASAILKVLEDENTQATHILESSASATVRAKKQPTLFGWEGEAEPKKTDTRFLHPILEQICSLNLDALTPLEAMNQLFHLKHQLKKESPDGSYPNPA